MIGDVLVFLRRHLNTEVFADDGDPDNPAGDRVVFVDGDKMDPITFKLGAVSELLINVEEERILRSADPYARVAADGAHQRVQPDIRLVLYLLFVARFKQYEVAWSDLSKIVQHFQSTRLLARDTHPDLPAGVGRLVPELVTLGMAEQNEIWNALRTTYHPSILYRVKLLAVRDRRPQAVDRLREDPVINLRRIS